MTLENLQGSRREAGSRNGGPVLTQRLRFIKPTLPPLESVVAAYQPAYASGVITNADVVKKFEASAREALEVKHAVAVSSCTSGLMLTFRALGLKGAVIVPSFTFFATAHAVVWNGLRPVFADCDPETWTIDPADVERRIDEHTSAIVGVHMYGNPCDIEALSRLAEKYKLKLIFDAAHAFGSRLQSRAIGQFGDAEVFSLSPTKLLVAGEGGLVATNDSLLAEKIRLGRNYGDSGDYDPEILGLNARMSEFNAALALAGMDLLSRKLQRHNEIAERYTKRLSGIPGISFQAIRRGNLSGYKDFSVCIDAQAFGRTRDEVAALLAAQNIDTKRYFYPPLHQQKLYSHFYRPSDGGLTHTEYVSGGVLSLPIYESLSDETVDIVASALEQVAEREAVR